MKIGILGAGAMGSLFGGYLSQHNEVWLIDVDPGRIDAIRSKGVAIRERDGVRVFRPNAALDASGLGPMELLMVFVKAMQSREALEKNRHLIGAQTYLMSLQNGAGHEEMLAAFAPPDRLILGTTQHNASRTPSGDIHHGGGGDTYIGFADADGTALESIAATFCRCGIHTAVSGNIRKQIWRKLFLNASASALTAVLQVQLGYLLDNPHAWKLVRKLLAEAVLVANAEGEDFNEEQIAAEVRTVLAGARDGYTSIYADIRDGVRTEVDTISGAVVTKAHRLGVSVPGLEFVVALIHAMEEKERGGCILERI